MNAFRSAYDLAFQVTPIILQGGIAAQIPGGMLPIISLTGQLSAFAQNTVSSASLSIDDFYARYIPIPGGTVISNSIGMYPFANQQIAANAIIEQPLHISLLMIAPVKSASGYITKLPLLTSLQTSLQNHNNSGGTYIIATPSFLYTNCIMTGMTDVTGGETKQQQVQWQIDFVKPLVTLQQAAAAYNGLMSKLSGGAQINAPVSWSGGASSAGSPVQGATALVQGIGQESGVLNNFLAQPL